MAYYSGIANSFAELATAVKDACVANGWTLTDGILVKGDLFVQVTFNETMSPTAQQIGAGVLIKGGTGQTAGVLSGACGATPRLGSPHRLIPHSWPMTYDLHVFTGPDEVYLVTRFNIDSHYYLAFGQSNVASLPGTGLWLDATAAWVRGGDGYDPAQTSRFYIHPTAGGYSFGAGFGNWLSSCAFMWKSNEGDTSGGGYTTFAMHTGIDPAKPWVGISSDTATQTALGPSTGYMSVNACNAVYYAYPHINRGLRIDGEAILVPIRPHQIRPSSKVSLVAEIKNARYVRVDNFTPGQIVYLGTEAWIVYPFYKKNTAQRDSGDPNLGHSGTLGWAIRYTGP